MVLSKFAERYRVRVKRDPEDNMEIVPGTEGRSHIFEYSEELLAVMILPETGTAHRWRSARVAFLRAGMTVVQNGDAEGVATFDPNNADQVKQALRYAKVRRRKEVSKAQLDQLRSMGFGGTHRTG